MNQDKEYFVFISYHRDDEKWAKWLAHKLDNYKLPTTLNGKELPTSLRKTFRDVDELSAGNLPEQIYQALSKSDNLIVVCSPRSANSKWVNKEVEDFIKIKGRASDYIFPFIIEGSPFAKDTEQECFPEALRLLPPKEERLGGNINEQGGREAAVVKVIAGMLDVSFDSLWNRYEREQKKRRNIRRGIIASIVLAALLITVWMIRSDWNMMKIQARAVAEKANALIDEGDSYTARRILLEVAPKNWVWKYWPNRPYVSEVEAAFRRANSNSSAIMRSTDHVRQVCICPDGQTIITASDGGNIVFWNRRECIPIDTLKAHDRFVFYIDMDSKGVQLLTSNGLEIKIWDFQTRTLMKTITPQRGFISTVSFSPDGKEIVAASIDNSTSNSKFLIWTWNSQTGDLMRTLRDSYYGDYWAEYSQDGKMIIGGDSSYQAKKLKLSPLVNMKLPGDVIRFWDTRSGEVIKTINVKGNCGCYNSQKQQVVSIDGDSVIIYNMSGDVLHVLKGHSKDIIKAIYSPDGNEILTYSDDLTIRIWDAGTGDVKKVLKGHTNSLMDVKFSPDGKFVVSAAADNTIRLWDIRSSSPVLVLGRNDGKEPELHYKTTFSYNGKTIHDSIYYIDHKIALSHNGKYLATSPSQGGIRLWNAENGLFYCKLKTKSWNTHYLMAFDNREKYLASFDSYYLYVWDLDNKELKYEKNIKRRFYYPKSIAFSPDAKKVATTYSDSLILVIDIEQNKSDSIKITNPEKIIFSPDGKSLAIVSDSILVVDAQTGITTVAIKKEERNSALSYSDDGRYLLYIDKWAIVIWDLVEKKEFKRLNYHDLYINEIMMSPDGKRIWAGGSDFVVVWDIISGVIIEDHHEETRYKEGVQLEHGDGSAFYASGGLIPMTAICPNSHMYAYSDGVDIKICKLPSFQELIEETRERFKNRQLTPEERKKYYLE